MSAHINLNVSNKKIEKALFVFLAMHQVYQECVSETHMGAAVLPYGYMSTVTIVSPLCVTGQICSRP